MSEPDPTALAVRRGLPAEMLRLRDLKPRSDWGPDLPEVAAFWLRMHDGFRQQQAAMSALAAEWRAGGLEARALHDRLIPLLGAYLQHLDGHHRIESGHYFPQFRRMAPDIQAGVDLLDRDHDAIHAELEALHGAGLAFHQAVQGGAPAAGDAASRLADRLDVSLPLATRHLDDEEDIVIPLIALNGGR